MPAKPVLRWIVLLIMCAVFTTRVMAHAAHSPFCEGINGTFVDNQSLLRFADSTGMGFKVGETLVVDAGGGSATSVRIEVPRGSGVASSGVPGTATYLIDTVGLTSAAVVADGGSFSGFIWCYAPDEFAVSQMMNGQTPPDSRINWRHGDLLAVIYPGSDVDGNPLLRVYAVSDGGKGDYLCTLHQVDLRPRPRQTARPDEPIKTCGNVVRFYRLERGALQVEIGPDAEGKVYRMVINPETMTVTERL
jgi:hypothetical protein